MIRIETYNGPKGRSYRAVIHKNLIRYRTSRYPTKDEAFKEGMKIFDELGIHINRGDFTQLPFYCFLVHWLEKHSKGVKESWKKDGCRIEKYIKPKLGQMKIRDIDSSILVDFFAWLKEQPANGIDADEIHELAKNNWSNSKIAKTLGIDRQTVAKFLIKDSPKLTASTVNRMYMLLHKIFQDALKIYRLIDYNPVDVISKAKEPDEIIKFWTQDEAMRFFESAIESSYYDLYLFAINTGVRPSEPLALKFEDINIEAQKILLTRQWDSEDKRFKMLKGKKKRFIQANAVVIATIQKLKRPKEQMGNKVVSDLVFDNGLGEPFNYREVYNDFKKICNKARVKNIGLHGLRHTYATWYIQNGGNWLKLQRFMGHSSYVTTQRYVHLVEDWLTREKPVVEFGNPNPTTPNHYIVPLFG